MEWKNCCWNHLYSIRSFFSVISLVEVLGPIHICVGCLEYSYLHIKLLVVEIIPYALTVLKSERRFVSISCCLPHISQFLIWIIFNEGTFVIILYFMSSRILLYFSLLIWRMWRRFFTYGNHISSLLSSSMVTNTCSGNIICARMS